MSLINQMLKDIDKRQAGKGLSYPIDESVRGVSAVASRSVFPIVIFVVLLGIVVLAYLYWDRLSAAKPTVTPLPVAVAPTPIPTPLTNEPEPPLSVASQTPTVSVAPAPLDAPTTPPSTPAVAATGPFSPQIAASKPEKQAAESAKKSASSRSLATGQDKPGQVVKALTVEQQSADLLRKAESQIRQGSVKDAQTILDKALVIYPGNQDARLLLARIYLQEGDLNTAIAILKQGLSDRGNTAEYHATLAAILQRKELHDEAIAQYIAALRRSPNNANWLVGLAISLQSKNQLPAAAEAYQQALDIGTLPPGLVSFAEQRLRQITR